MNVNVQLKRRLTQLEKGSGKDEMVGCNMVRNKMGGRINNMSLTLTLSHNVFIACTFTLHCRNTLFLNTVS